MCCGGEVGRGLLYTDSFQFQIFTCSYIEHDILLRLFAPGKKKKCFVPVVLLEPDAQKEGEATCHLPPLQTKPILYVQLSRG